MPSNRDRTERSRSLRQTQTEAEGILWSLLRSKQLCGLKFRRQHPIGPFFADFACLSHRVVVELDGGYHDQIPDEDIARQNQIARMGWQVIRFANDDVLKDAEAVLRSIAGRIGMPYTFAKRSGDGAGMLNEASTNGNAIKRQIAQSRHQSGAPDLTVRRSGEP